MQLEWKLNDSAEIRNSAIKEPSLTLNVVVVFVVEAEVVGQLPAHHQLLDEGPDGGAEAPPTTLHLQGGALGRELAWSQGGREETGTES